MSTESAPRVPEEKSTPRRQYVGSISLAHRIAVQPGETRNLNPFALRLPNLAGSLELMLAFGELQVSLQSYVGKDCWSELPRGSTSVIVGWAQLAPAPLNGRQTRVVLSNRSHLPAFVLSAEMRLAAEAPPAAKEKSDAE